MSRLRTFTVTENFLRIIAWIGVLHIVFHVAVFILLILWMVFK